jgi:hypothetical protein
MAIKINLEITFDTAAELVELLDGTSRPIPANVDDHVGPLEYWQRVSRSEERAKPLMDLLFAELAKQGLEPVRLPSEQTQGSLPNPELK